MLSIEKKPAEEEKEFLFGGFSCVCSIGKLAALGNLLHFGVVDRAASAVLGESGRPPRQPASSSHFSVHFLKIYDKSAAKWKSVVTQKVILPGFTTKQAKMMNLSLFLPVSVALDASPASLVPSRQHIFLN